MRKRTVYVLCHEGSDIGRDVYVGSTSQKLSKRLSEHKYDCHCYNKKIYEDKLLVWMFQVGVENWMIRPLLTLECSKEVIREFELVWINILKCDLNMISPIQDDKNEKDRVLRIEEKNVDEKKYFCNVCEKAFRSNWKLKRHKSTFKHSNKFFNTPD